MARFKLQGRMYTTASLDEISLKHLVLFNDQAEDMGMRRRWHDVERVAEEISDLTQAQADRHPERLLVIAVTIWASRILAGDPVSLEQAIDFPMSEIEFIPEPKDRQPGKRKGAKKAPAKKATRKGSAPGVSRRVNEPSATAEAMTPGKPSLSESLT